MHYNLRAILPIYLGKEFQCLILSAASQRRWAWFSPFSLSLS